MQYRSSSRSYLTATRSGASWRHQERHLLAARFIDEPSIIYFWALGDLCSTRGNILSRKRRVNYKPLAIMQSGKHERAVHTYQWQLPLPLAVTGDGPDVMQHINA